MTSTQTKYLQAATLDAPPYGQAFSSNAQQKLSNRKMAFHSKLRGPRWLDSFRPNTKGHSGQKLAARLGRSAAKRHTVHWISSKPRTSSRLFCPTQQLFQTGSPLSHPPTTPQQTSISKTPNLSQTSIMGINISGYPSVNISRLKMKTSLERDFKSARRGDQTINLTVRFIGCFFWIWF